MGVPLETVRTLQRRELSMLREHLAPPAGPVAAVTFWIAAVTVKAKSIVAAATVALLSLLLATVWWQATANDPAPLSEPAGTATATPSADGGDNTSGTTAAPVTGPNTRRIAAEPPEPLPTTATIRVRVVWRAAQAPVPGMAVLCRTPDRPGTFATTDGAGEVEFTALEPGTYRVQLHDWTNESLTIAAGEERIVELSIGHTKAATGIVLDPTDRPVAGAEILVSAGGVQPQWSFPAALSDAHGEFDLAGLRTHSLIGARHAEHGTSDFRMLLGDPPNGSAHALTLRLPGIQSALRGHVIDGQGTTIPGAWVSIGEYHGPRPDADGNLHQPPPATICTTDAEGRFAATGLRPGDRRLSIYRNAFAPHRRTVPLTEGETTDVSIVLQPGAVLTGTVTTASGEPVANARIGSDSSQYPAPSAIQTDSDGHFRLQDLEPGEHGFEVTAPDYPRQHRSFELKSGVEQEWIVVLAESSGISGQLLDQNGGPLANWWVGLQSANRRAKTDAEGRFVLPEARAQDNTLLVRDAPGFAPVRARFENVAANAIERTFVIGPEHAPTARLRGRLLDGDGGPLAGIEIGLEQEGWPVFLGDTSSKSRADGTFEVGPLPPGNYDVTPAPGRWVFEPVTAVLESDAACELGTLRGALPARLTVELTGDEAQIARARVMLITGGRRINGHGAGSSRAFERLFPRDYELVVRVDDRDCHRIEVSVDPGSELSRSLTVQ